MFKTAKAVARGSLEFLNTYSSESKGARAVERLERRAPAVSVRPSEDHLDAAMAWLARAQDAHKDGGVAWGYRARRPVRSNVPIGWVGPYPETTGYIIPTTLRYGRRKQVAEWMDRAQRMTNWEISIQLPDGGFQGGVYGAQPVESSTFVTGQVLFGLVAAFETFSEEKMRASATRAGDWLLSCLDDTGRFVRGYSHFCLAGPKAYEVRTGLALAELGDAAGVEKYRDAASKMADYALSCQQPNGWFSENDLNLHDRPLTHTIGYVLEGLHGLSNRLGRQDCLEAVDRTLASIAGIVQENGFLAGRLRSDWTPAVEWACLTGSSQIAGVFLRRFEETGRREYFDTGRKLLGFVCFTQELKPGIPGIDGGIRGSYPFGGEYGQWCVLNWPTKFFCDSTMDYLQAERKLGVGATAR